MSKTPFSSRLTIVLWLAGFFMGAPFWAATAQPKSGSYLFDEVTPVMDDIPGGTTLRLTAKAEDGTVFDSTYTVPEGGKTIGQIRDWFWSALNATGWDADLYPDPQTGIHLHGHRNSSGDLSKVKFFDASKNGEALKVSIDGFSNVLACIPSPQKNLDFFCSLPATDPVTPGQIFVHLNAYTLTQPLPPNSPPLLVLQILYNLLISNGFVAVLQDTSVKLDLTNSTNAARLGRSVTAALGVEGAVSTPHLTLGLPDYLPLTATLIPAGMPIQIPPSGGSFSYQIRLRNDGAALIPTQLWCNATFPNDSLSGPTLGPVNINFVAGGVITRNRNFNVPGNWAPGSYRYNEYLGAYPNLIISRDDFVFTKLSSGAAGGPEVWEAFDTGESFEENVLDSPPSSFSLHPGIPNPFNATTALSYKLQAASHVSLRVYDTAGRSVETLVESWQEAGAHEVVFDGSRLASGIYLAKLVAFPSGSGATPTTAVQKLVLLK